MISIIKSIVTTITVLSFLALFASSVRAQSFSVDTITTPDTGSFDYSFTVNYDQAGAVQLLSAPIFDWSFYIDPTGLAPTNIQSPTGWQTSYDPTSGEFDWYTQGPTGFGNGDFGPNIIQPGVSLSGFGFTSADTPGLSIAFATDEEFNQDANFATIPTTAPVAAPEARTALLFGIGVTMLLGLLIQRNKRRLTTYI